MLPGQHVVGERGGIGETLHRRVEEAGVAKVLQACPDAMDLVPLQAEAVRGEQNLLGQGNAVSTGQHCCTQQGTTQQQ